MKKFHLRNLLLDKYDPHDAILSPDSWNYNLFSIWLILQSNNLLHYLKECKIIFFLEFISTIWLETCLIYYVILLVFSLGMLISYNHV